MKRYFLLIALCVFSCKKSETDPDPLKTVSHLTAEINEMIKPKSCATDPKTCVIRIINSLDGCGPAFVYNANDVNIQAIDAKFSALDKANVELDKILIRDMICNFIAPDSTYVEDCQCKATKKTSK